MATIFDVAKRAGVSIATVSRVLTQPDVVAPATRRKVMRRSRAVRLRSQREREEPARAQHPQVDRHGPRHRDGHVLAGSCSG